ncbi:MAG: HD domain-containing protein [Clostridia bacterium]|nr:HD domain-containing protein [Clostridia bacterium]
MTRVFINQFEEGQQIAAPFLIKTKQLLPFKSKNGKFLHLVVGDKTGDIEGRLWENGEEIFTQINDLFVVTIEGEVVRFRDALQLNITGIRPCSDFSPADFLPESPKDRNEMINTLRRHVAGITNPHLKSFIKTLFGDNEFFQRFTLAPAAKHHHQAYLGGLLEHTLGVVSICQSLAQIYPGVNGDLLTVGAIIHDMGKVEELAYSDTIDYTDQGRLIGHIVIGAQLAGKVVEKLPDFPEELGYKLIHMIVSHHGQYEWQSPKRPQFLEAMLLHHADMLDSQVDKFLRVHEQAKGEAAWSPWIKGLDRYLYLK